MAIDVPAGRGAAADQRRRRPTWIPTVAAFLAIAVCLTAASWQHRRMLEKEALQTQINVAAAKPSVPLPADVADWNGWRFRTVTLTGEFDARHQILIDNAQHGGRVGFDVVTPFAGLTKADVLELGTGLMLQHTFSCIDPQGGRHCGRCNKCAERRLAFSALHIDDVTEYKQP